MCQGARAQPRTAGSGTPCPSPLSLLPPLSSAKGTSARLRPLPVPTPQHWTRHRPRGPPEHPLPETPRKHRSGSTHPRKPRNTETFITWPTGLNYLPWKNKGSIQAFGVFFFFLMFFLLPRPDTAVTVALRRRNTNPRLCLRGHPDPPRVPPSPTLSHPREHTLCSRVTGSLIF